MNKHDLVLSYLEDEISRQIYRMQLEHTEDALKNIVDRYLPQIYEKYGKVQSEKEKQFASLLRGKKNVIIGAGIRGMRAINFCKNADIGIEQIADNDVTKQGMYIDHLRIAALSDINYSAMDNIVITQDDLAIVMDVRTQLMQMGEGIAEKIIEYRDYHEVLEMTEEQYFAEDFIKLNDNEFFIDAGVLDLQTTMQFIQECRRRGIKGEKVLAFEPDRISYQRCLNTIKELNVDNIMIHNAGLWSCEDTLHFYEEGNGFSKLADKQTKENNRMSMIKVVALDHYVSEKVTYLKMDVEGAELEALKGSKETIKKYKPKLAICIYHKREDLTEIPLYIKELVPEYKFYIRHYSTSFAETVLYAVID